MRFTVVGVSLVCLVVAGCGGRPEEPPTHRAEDWHSPVQMLLRYVGPDGNLTRAQLETGLHQEFAVADVNHSGVLEPDEVRAVNQQRWKEDQSAISPLQDWNGDGVIDFNEFAATARALFNEMDLDHNGVLTPKELRPGRERSKDGQDGRGDGRGGPPGGGQGGGRGGRPGGG
jgi:hypothetical protein